MLNQQCLLCLFMNVYSIFLHLHCPPSRCTCCSCPFCRSLPWLCRTPPHSAPYSPTRWCLVQWYFMHWGNMMQWYVNHGGISWINMQLSCKASDFVQFLKPCGFWWFCICSSARLKELEPKWMRPPFWRSSSPTCKGSDLRLFKTNFLLLRQSRNCRKRSRIDCWLICWFSQVAWNIFTNGKQTLGLNLSERFSITDNALIHMKVTKVLCLILNQNLKNPSLNPQPLFTVAWHGRHENGPEWDNPDVQVQASFPDQVPRSLNNQEQDIFSQTRRLPTEDQPRRRRHPKYPQLVQQVLKDIALRSFLIFEIISADGIFLNHLSQDIRGTNSSAVWRFF